MKFGAMLVKAGLFTTAVLALGAVPASTVHYNAQIVWSGLGATNSSRPLLVTKTVAGRVEPVISSLHVTIDPPPPAMPRISWKALDPQRVRLMSADPNAHILRLPGDSAYLQPSPADYIGAAPGALTGVSTVQAIIGAPVNARITLPAYSYRNTAVSCTTGVISPGIAFDPQGVAHATQTVASSDIYMTGPEEGPRTGLFNGCTAAFVDPNATKYTLHVPGGAVLIAASYLPGVTADQWRDEFTELLDFQANATLLFKTRDGRIGKIIASGDSVNGGYLIADRHGKFDDTLSLQGKRERVVFTASQDNTAPQFKVRIAYSDPATNVNGPVREAFAMLPYKERTPFWPFSPSLRIVIHPAPYGPVPVEWSYENTSANQPSTQPLPITSNAAGRSLVTAMVGAPVFARATIPVITYDSLVLGCGVASQGLRFTPGGQAVPASSPADSDLYISSDPAHFACGNNPVLHFPGGGIFLSNGSEPNSRVATGGYPGPQFPELRSSSWRNTATQMDLDAWRRLGDPCTAPEFPGVVRIVYGCTTLPAKTLLFHTRSGRAVKFLLLNANGLTIMGGPFAVLN